MKSFYILLCIALFRAILERMLRPDSDQLLAILIPEWFGRTHQGRHLECRPCHPASRLRLHRRFLLPLDPVRQPLPLQWLELRFNQHLIHLMDNLDSHQVSSLDSQHLVSLTGWRDCVVGWFLVCNWTISLGSLHFGDWKSHLLALFVVCSLHCFRSAKILTVPIGRLLVTVLVPVPVWTVREMVLPQASRTSFVDSCSFF